MNTINHSASSVSRTQARKSRRSGFISLFLLGISVIQVRPVQQFSVHKNVIVNGGLAISNEIALLGSLELRELALCESFSKDDLTILNRKEL